ncbi:hypothetical protein QE152_g4702 [Popillia japonica]|uniref:Transposable element P transposase-like RNase H domain-containing protein n=1 Tax=Popillia japonica TaxID=7064 RepID=A0AAW1MZ97_POPJA
MWTKTQQELALALYYKSPPAYKFLRKPKIVLPSVLFNCKILSSLKLKVISTMDEAAKECVVIFDEMKLKTLIEYSKYLDMIGFEDFGQEMGRTRKLGTDALVILLRVCTIRGNFH